MHIVVKDVGLDRFVIRVKIPGDFDWMTQTTTRWRTQDWSRQDFGSRFW